MKIRVSRLIVMLVPHGTLPFDKSSPSGSAIETIELSGKDGT
jgi:hypothetical protein